MDAYSPKSIEAKWQGYWERFKTHQATDPGGKGEKKPKFYALVEFPYPSGAGLHVGHVRAYSAMDAYARKKRMEGYNVLYPMGWDAFGLPAENYALKVGTHPSQTVTENIARFKSQCQSLGLSFDWSREINTTDPRYYRWTQWIFLKLLEGGLAYRTEVLVNWCPACRTNLADEEVLPDGTHERCGTSTEKRPQRQWVLKITAYAERLLADLNLVDFSPQIRRQQENWIGRKDGIKITYKVKGTQASITCFTTRPDTNFGATFVVLAPEHSFVTDLINHKVKLIDSQKVEEITGYVRKAKVKSPLERISEGRAKTGVFSGLYVINELNGRELPIWISDFVLPDFGTGAVVGVPGHDLRDFEFAQTFGLPIVRVVVGPDGDRSEIKRKEQVQENAGVMVSSGFLDGLPIESAIAKMMDFLEEKGWGQKMTTYHLRDWVFSRQHYWGEPIPVIYCRKCLEASKFKDQSSKLMKTVENGVEYAIVPIAEDQLPLELPFVERYEPSGTGESPLSTITDWVNTVCPRCGGPARRETDTMPNWAGSNWYYLAYLFADKLGNYKSQILSTKQAQSSNDSKVSDLEFSASDFKNIFSENKNVLDYWLPVDIYEGGFEHTTLHLLYSRFIYKFLYDLKVVPGPEPYAKRRSHGIVLGPDGRKMSKSFGNVINPEEVVGRYGADSLRLYEMFMGPFDQSVAWSEESLQGCYRFLGRVTTLLEQNVKSQPPPAILSQKLQQLIARVSQDLENLKFNTAVAALMEFSNAWGESFLAQTEAEIFLKLLAPLAPHLTEELYQKIRGQEAEVNRFESIHQQSWPVADLKVMEESTVEIVVQIDGRLKAVLKVAAATSSHQDAVVDLALKQEKVRALLEGKSYRVIFVKGKLINFVID